MATPPPAFFGATLKPLCPVCGDRHEPYQAHIFKTAAVVNEVVNKRGKDRHKDKEARRVYLREYMRKRRAAKAA